jgi:hypothetical protein
MARYDLSNDSLEVSMAKTNFQYEKRQRELEKKRKAEEKARKKQEAKQHKGEGEGDAPALDEDSGEEAQQEHDPA